MPRLLFNSFIGILLCTFSVFGFTVNGEALPTVRSISEMETGSHDITGHTQITVAGALRDGFKEVEVWLGTLSPGSITPIHRHSCEEILMVLSGSGTVYIASDDSSSEFPGIPQAFHFSANTTVNVPVNNVHQVANTNKHEDLHLYTVISRPPMKAYFYDNWTTPHTAAKLIFPLYWDVKFYNQSTKENDEL